MRRLISIIDTLSKLAAYLSAVMMALIVIMMLGEIFARMFRRTLSFTWEYGAYLNGAIFFLGAAYTARTGGQIRVEWAKNVLPPRLFRLLEMSVTLVAFSVGTLLSVSLTRYAYESYSGWVRSDTITGTPLVYPKGALAVGAILLTLQLLARFIRLATGESPEITEATDSVGLER